jgi:hypothetical protein
MTHFLITMIIFNLWLSRAFIRFSKIPISFVMSVCLSVRPSVRPAACPLVSAWLPLDGFSGQFILGNFTEICRQNPIFGWNRTKMTDDLDEDQNQTFRTSRCPIERDTGVAMGAKQAISIPSINFTGEICERAWSVTLYVYSLFSPFR